MTFKPLRIAHAAPLFASIPPLKYGGTERVLDWLIRAQIEKGHDVTLFASGDSCTPAKLVPVIPEAIWNYGESEFPNIYHTIELDMLLSRSEEFDVIHYHFNFMHLQSVHFVKTPIVSTLHWRVDLKEFQDLYNYFTDVPLVAISESQKSYIPQANVVDVVYHGLPTEDYTFCPNKGDYLAFVGRLSPEKGVHIALETAIRTGLPIKIAARIPDEAAGRKYYEETLKPMMNDPLVEYVGELNEKEKIPFMGKALATLVPTCWPEPFGLVAIESLAVGTPVVAYPVGGTKEIVKDGVVGFAVNSVDEMIEAVKKIEIIDRNVCRKHIEKHFSSKRMADSYDKIYRKLI